MGKRIKLPRISRPTQPISQPQPEQQPQPEAQPQPEQQQTMLTGRDKFQQAMDKRRRELERKQMMGFQNELDEADTKEMLGDKFGEYEKAMSALGSPVEQREYSKQGELERQQAKRREVRQQFGLQGEGADDPLAKFRTDRRNKQIDEKIAKYGSFDKYETETRTENRKKQIQDLINRGDIDAAMAAENQFKDEDTKRDTKRTQIEDFRKRYGLEAPAPVDERERFGTYLDQKRQPKQNFGDLRNLIGGGNMRQPMPGQRPMPRPMPALPEQPPMQPPMGGSVKPRPGKRPIGIRRPQPGINVDGGTSSRTRINAPNLRGFRF